MVLEPTDSILHVRVIIIYNIFFHLLISANTHTSYSPQLFNAQEYWLREKHKEVSQFST